MKALSGFGITWSISMSLGKAPGHSMATLTMSAGGGMAAYGALAALSRKLQDDHPHLARSQTHLCHLALYTLKNAQASFQIQRPYCNDDDHCHQDDRRRHAGRYRRYCDDDDDDDDRGGHHNVCHYDDKRSTVDRSIIIMTKIVIVVTLWWSPSSWGRSSLL